MLTTKIPPSLPPLLPQVLDLKPLPSNATRFNVTFVDGAPAASMGGMISGGLGAAAAAGELEAGGIVSLASWSAPKVDVRACPPPPLVNECPSAAS